MTGIRGEIEKLGNVTDNWTVLRTILNYFLDFIQKEEGPEKGSKKKGK